MRTAPPPQLCRCGAGVRLVMDRHGARLVDEEPLVGGPLIVNVDTVVLRQSPNSGDLGFRPHLCLLRYV